LLISKYKIYIALQELFYFQVMSVSRFASTWIFNTATKSVDVVSPALGLQVGGENSALCGVTRWVPTTPAGDAAPAARPHFGAARVGLRLALPCRRKTAPSRRPRASTCTGSTSSSTSTSTSRPPTASASSSPRRPFPPPS